MAHPHNYPEHVISESTPTMTSESTSTDTDNREEKISEIIDIAVFCEPQQSLIHGASDIDENPTLSIQANIDNDNREEEVTEIIDASVSVSCEPPLSPTEGGFDIGENETLSIQAKIAKYNQLLTATFEGKWNDAEKVFIRYPEATQAVMSPNNETILHLAVTACPSIHFVRELLKRMKLPYPEFPNRVPYKEALQSRDSTGHTALAASAIEGNLEAAKLLVPENQWCLLLEDDDKLLPLHLAAKFGNSDMVEYLYENTITEFDKEEQIKKTLARVEREALSKNYGRTLLFHLITSGFVDVALKLVKRYTELALPVDVAYLPDIVKFPLLLLAAKPEVFHNGRQRRSSVELVKLMSVAIVQSNSENLLGHLQKAFLEAVKSGVHQMVKEIMTAYPLLFWLYDHETNNRLFDEAILNRHEKVFNFINLTKGRHKPLKYLDKDGNNILHLVALFPGQPKLDVLSGDALNMQRELQWFKEVEKMVKPFMRNSRNLKGDKPSRIFSETHKHLINGGEKWMKSTATSCSVVATLIATIVFAAAITVPGTNTPSGQPNFFKNRVFTIFAYADSISFFSSAVAIVMFTSILTARYAEDDFLSNLPTRMILGLLSLLISITAMMIAFVSTTFLVFGFKGGLALGLVSFLASLPPLLFAAFQGKILLCMVRYTWGPSVFGLDIFGKPK